VAWEAKKTLFLLKDSIVLGYNYHAIFSIDKNKSIEVSIPIKKFNSSDLLRDREIIKILDGKKHKEIFFKSNPLSKSDIVKIKNKKLKIISGDFKISSREYKVKFKLSYDDSDFVYGYWEGKLSSFDIDPPEVLGGVVASVKDDLKLHVKVNIKTMV
jgi:hypothetical protein